jgi:hypothetical protein
MSNIEFEGENQNQHNSFLYAKFQASNQKPGIVNFLIRKNIVKNQAQANAVLLILVLACLAAAYFVYQDYNSQAVLMSPEQLIQSRTLQ